MTRDPSPDGRRSPGHHPGSSLAEISLQPLVAGLSYVSTRDVLRFRSRRIHATQSLPLASHQRRALANRAARGDPDPNIKISLDRRRS